ncbi:MAG: carboxypeptidase-like regulatory domain-containing protein [Acidobacteriota bacterium]
MRKQVGFALVIAFFAVLPVDGAASRTTEFHQIGLPVPSDKVLNITLPDGYFLSGIVKDANGAVLKSADVMATGEDDGMFGGWGTTDAAGKFSFPVQSGSYNVQADPPAGTSVDPKKFSRLLPQDVDNIAVNGDTAMGEIRLINGYILSGQVKPPSGTLAIFSGVLAAFSNDNTQTASAQFGTGTETAKFAVALPAGSYKLLLWPMFGFDSAFQPVAMTYKTDKVTITKDTVKNMTAPKGYKLSGTVKDTASAALDGVIYIFKKSGAYVPGMYMMFFAVVDGRYEGYLAPGTYDLLFVPFIDTTYKGKASRMLSALTMPAAAKVVNLVPPNGVVLSGKVTDARKKVVKGASVGLVKTGALASACLLEAAISH